MTTYRYTSKADVAYAQIRERILDGTLAAGSRLNQYELADEMGISITPLREAVRRLSGEGWIELDAHKNARVAGLDLTQARDLLEVRQILEPTAARLAAARRSESDIDELNSAEAALIPITREWGEDALTRHTRFHQALYRASHNGVLIRSLDDLWARSDRYRRHGLTLPPGAEPRTRDLDEHRKIADAVIEGDGDRAFALVESHIANSLSAAALLSAQGLAELGE